jgi:hypothetical protein
MHSVTSPLDSNVCGRSESDSQHAYVARSFPKGVSVTSTRMLSGSHLLITTALKAPHSHSYYQKIPSQQQRSASRQHQRGYNDTHNPPEQPLNAMAHYLRSRPSKSISNTTNMPPPPIPFMAYQEAFMTTTSDAACLTIAYEYYKKQMASERRQQAEIVEREQQRLVEERE